MQRSHALTCQTFLLTFLLMFLLMFLKLSQVTGEEPHEPPDGGGGAFFALRSCHQLLHADAGEFFSPDYLCSNPPLWCNWTIRVGPGKRVHLHLEDMTPDDACHLKQDQVHVDEPAGLSGGLKVLQKCWREAKYTSSSNAVSVVLLIGGWPGTPYRGFYGRYQAFGPPVVYKPQEGLAGGHGDSDPSLGLTGPAEQTDPDPSPESERTRGSEEAPDPEEDPYPEEDPDPEEAPYPEEDPNPEVDPPPPFSRPTAPASTQGTLRSGRDAAQTPPALRDLAVHPEDQNQELKPTTDHNQDLKLRTDHNQELKPSTDQKQEVKPSTDQNQELKPSTDQNQVLKPSTDQNQELKPSTDQNQELKPTTDQNQELKPSTDQNQELKPTTDQNQELKPTTDQNQELKPTTDQNQELKSSTDQNQELKPTTDQNQELKSSTDQNQELKPSTDQNQELKPSTDQNQELKPSTDQNQELKPSTDQNQELKSSTDQNQELKPTTDQNQSAENRTQLHQTSDQLPPPSRGPEPEQTPPRPNVVEPLSDHRGPAVRNHSEGPQLPGDHLFEVAVEVAWDPDRSRDHMDQSRSRDHVDQSRSRDHVDRSRDHVDRSRDHVEDSWDHLSRSLLLSVKTLISERLKVLHTPFSTAPKRIKRLNGGVLYILWLQMGPGPGGLQVHRAVHSALQGLVAVDVGSRGRLGDAVITSVSTADVNECGTQLVLCHVNADCLNQFGSYSCRCRPGFRDESLLGSGGTACVDAAAAGCSSAPSPETKGVYVLFFLLSALILMLLAAAGVLYRRHHQGAFLVRCPSVPPPDPNNNHHHGGFSGPVDSDLPPPPPPVRGFVGGWAQVKERRPDGDLPLLRFSPLPPPPDCREPREDGKM